jgi:hypothetical protein
MEIKILLVILICLLVLALVWLANPGIIGMILEVISLTTITTTNISITTVPMTTTVTPTTLLTTTTLENATTTIQVRKPISVIAYSCDRETDIITLTISNRGNTRIEEDEIDVYINDEYKGTFGKTIEKGQLSRNSFQGNQGLNIVKVVSPSNSVRIVIHCY